MNDTEETSKLLPPPSPLAFKEKIGKAKMVAFGTFALLFVAVAITANAQNHGTDATLLRNKETELKQSVTYTSKCLQPSSGPVLSGYDVVAYHSLDSPNAVWLCAKLLQLQVHRRARGRALGQQ